MDEDGLAPGKEVAPGFADAAHALQHSESQLAHTGWGASVGLWDHDVVTDTLQWWSDWYSSIDLDPCHGSGHSVRWNANVHPDDISQFVKRYDSLITGQTDIYESEYRILNRSGSWRWVLSRGRATARGDNGHAVRLAGATIDIDARKRMELAQREREARLRMQAMILETLREGVVLAALDGRIEFTNPAFDRMFGRKPEELRGNSLLELFNHRQIHSSASALESLLEQHRNGAKRDMLFRRRNGGQFVGEVLSAEIDVSGERRILVVVQDVSERKQLESEIIEIANRERRRLGADLHDGLGQELTGISLMLRSLAKRADLEASGVATQINEIIALANHAIQSTRKMALGVSPVTLERGGLLPALQSLVARAQDNFNVDVQLRLAIRSPLLVGESASTHLYLIAQEAINNAARHGHARSIAVTLRVNRTVVCLSITDDGSGFVGEAARGSGMGLKIMGYRSTVIGGVMKIKGLPNGGTRVCSVCPQGAGAAAQS